MIAATDDFEKEGSTVTKHEKALTERVAELEEALMQIREEIDTILGRREEEEEEDDEDDFDEDEDEDLDEDLEEDEDDEDEDVYE